MKAAYLTGYLFLALLALSLVACGGGPAAEEDASSSTATSPTAELTTAGDEAPTSAAPPDAEESSEVASEPAAAPVADCEPTQPDMLGPYYVPGAPMRTSVDSGYVTSGNVLSADGCEPIPGAQIEFWLADSQGNYDDAHRATMLAGERGEYQFQSNFPGFYENRPPHIHVRVTAPGFRELVTQHYPQAGQTEASFDLVLEPA
jgi:protocatechuate 3,4-dioxygenase beta subunit